jgi:hypothetical protein
MFCPQCGAPNEDDATFCGNCGAVLAAEEQPAQTAAEAAEGASPIEGTGAALPEPALPPPVKEVELLPPPPAYSAAPAQFGAALQTSGLAIASLILGIGGLTFLPLLGSIVAVFLGYAARRDIRSRPGELGGGGVATVGLVLGWIGIGLAVLGLIFFGGVTVCGICAAAGQGH